MKTSSFITSELWSLAQNLLKSAGLGGKLNLFPLPGGRNNRVFRLECDEGEFLFKQYFHSPEDLRDRLKHEYLFLEYLFASDSAYAARPYAVDPENHVALMEFISGARIEITEIGNSHIEHAIKFFQELNLNKSSHLARALPIASEACFTLAEHMCTTQRRIDRLKNIPTTLPVDKQAYQFVEDALIPFWQIIRRHIESSSTESFDHTLSIEERCLSPSDFGFHNALQQEDASLRFVDFEYAGWDDPAKLIADFANQPDMTLDRHLSDRFKSAVIEASAEPVKLQLRVGLLEPLYQVKWGCICLNDFLTVGKDRRDFTDEKQVEIARKLFQLKRAQKMLERARETFSCSI